jgi:uncharacterized protein YqhQ
MDYHQLRSGKKCEVLFRQRRLVKLNKSDNGQKEGEKKSQKIAFLYSILLFLVIIFSLSRFFLVCVCVCVCVCVYITIQRTCACVLFSSFSRVIFWSCALFNDENDAITHVSILSRLSQMHLLFFLLFFSLLFIFVSFLRPLSIYSYSSFCRT